MRGAKTTWTMLKRTLSRTAAPSAIGLLALSGGEACRAKTAWDGSAPNGIVCSAGNVRHDEQGDTATFTVTCDPERAAKYDGWCTETCSFAVDASFEASWDPKVQAKVDRFGISKLRDACRRRANATFDCKMNLKDVATDLREEAQSPLDKVYLKFLSRDLGHVSQVWFDFDPANERAIKEALAKEIDTINKPAPRSVAKSTAPSSASAPSPSPQPAESAEPKSGSDTTTLINEQTALLAKLEQWARTNVQVTWSSSGRQTDTCTNAVGYTVPCTNAAAISKSVLYKANVSAKVTNRSGGFVTCVFDDHHRQLGRQISSGGASAADKQDVEPLPPSGGHTFSKTHEFAAAIVAGLNDYDSGVSCFFPIRDMPPQLDAKALAATGLVVDQPFGPSVLLLYSYKFAAKSSTFSVVGKKGIFLQTDSGFRKVRASEDDRR